MSLGVLKVGAVLREAGHEVAAADLSGVQDWQSVLSGFLDCDAFGITSTTPQFPFVARISRWLKQETNKRLILGGPHPTLTWNSLKQSQRASLEALEMLRLHDCVVIGDGEQACTSAFTGNYGLIDADGGKWAMTPAQYRASPLPARDLLDVSSYKFHVDGQWGLSLISQLGCPFACSFCSGRSSPTFRRIRSRDIQDVIQEVRVLHEQYGATGFMFYDDELNVNRQMVGLMRGLTDLQKAIGVQFRLRGCIKAELFNQEQADAMAEAGFSTVLVGFESGHPRILENINKKATVEENTRCRELARAAGIKVKALMSLGHPGESPETAEATGEWLKAVAPDEFDVTIITCTPGSPYYDKARRNGQHWTYTAANGDALHQSDVAFSDEPVYYKGIPGRYTSHTWTDALSRPDICRIRDQMEAEVASALGIDRNRSPFDSSMGQTSPHFLLA